MRLPEVGRSDDYALPLRQPQGEAGMCTPDDMVVVVSDPMSEAQTPEMVNFPPQETTQGHHQDEPANVESQNEELPTQSYVEVEGLMRKENMLWVHLGIWTQRSVMN